MLEGIISQQVLLSAVMFVVVLGILVFVHELGHYLAAKTVNVKVLAFSIGFGKEIFGFNRKNGERWKISIFPLGGYVDLFGMDPEGEDVKDEKNQKYLGQAFYQKNVWARIWVVFAGPLANFLFAFVALAGAYYVSGVKELSTVVGQVRENMPAAEAGISVGDKIISVSGENVSNWSELVEAISTSDVDKELEIVVLRNEQELTFILPTVEREVENLYNKKEKRRLIGIMASANYINTRELTLTESITESAEYVSSFTVNILDYIKRMVTRESKAELGGPLTIAEASGKATESGFYVLVIFLVHLSINLAVLNLLPIPMLDGGHIFYALIEIVSFGRGLHEKIKVIANYLGMLLLVSLMVYVFYKDIERIFF